MKWEPSLLFLLLGALLLVFFVFDPNKISQRIKTSSLKCPIDYSCSTSMARAN